MSLLLVLMTAFSLAFVERNVYTGRHENAHTGLRREEVYPFLSMLPYILASAHRISVPDGDQRLLGASDRRNEGESPDIGYRASRSEPVSAGTLPSIRGTPIWLDREPIEMRDSRRARPRALSSSKVSTGC